MRIGFVGIGRLGQPIAQRILGAGFPLVIWARRPSALQELVATGAQAVRHLEDAGATSDIVCICVTDEPDVLDILQGGLLEGMAEGSLLVIHSTVRPSACELFAELAAPYGVEVLDAPLCGGPYTAAQGTLPIPVGGTSRSFELCLPLLSTYGGLIRHCGPLGSGQRVKLIFNLLYAASVEIVHDGLEVAEGWGLERRTVADFLTGFPHKGFVGGRLAAGQADSQTVAHNRRLLAKDVNYALELLTADEVPDGKVGVLARAALESLDAVAKSCTPVDDP